MATTLLDIRFEVERNTQETNLDDSWIVNQANIAQTEIMLRVFIPGSTTLAVNTTDLEYTLPATIQSIRQIRSQTNLDNGYNIPIYPIYTFYDGIFSVPVAFSQPDTLLIDYYAYLKTFTDVTDTIDLPDRYKNLYVTYIQAMYYNLPSTKDSIGVKYYMKNYDMNMNYYMLIKKQITDAYINRIGIQKPLESGW